MADTYTLEAQRRTVTGKHVKHLRRQDIIPAIIYGAGSEPVSISCVRRTLETVLANAGNTHLIEVNVDGASHNTLVREVQRDKIRRTIMHVDFLEVDLTKLLRTEVQIVLTHTPRLGADLMMSQNLLSVEVECLPTNIPEHVELNVSGLTQAGARLTVADLAQLPNVTILNDPTEVVVRIETLAAEEAEEGAAEGAPVEPEVVERGKKEEEEEF
ncbi:MAG: 50S ribosomal protein L25 [Anaerolineae bacterium]|nr:50S ribosomal protein L25 [Anaerolineae bacterium]